MADLTIESLTAELATVRDKLTEANGEAKHHRLSAQAYRTQVEELRGERDRLKETSATELDAAMKKAADDADRLRLDLTGRAVAAETAAANVRTRAQERARAADLRIAANEAGLRDIDALKLLDSGTLKLSEDGDVTNAAEAMEAFKAAKPYLFGQAATSSTATPPPVAPSVAKRATDMTPVERVAAARAAGISAITS